MSNLDVVILVNEVEGFLKEFALKLEQLQDPYLTKLESTHRNRLTRETTIKIFDLIVPIMGEVKYEN